MEIDVDDEDVDSLRGFTTKDDDDDVESLRGFTTKDADDDVESLRWFDLDRGLSKEL